MKKSEIEALKEAFNIPEPERKNSFLPFFKEQLKKNNGRLCIPMVLRYASAAVLAAVIIGLWGVLNPSVDFSNEPDNSFIVVESDTTTESSMSGTGTHTSSDSDDSDKNNISQTTSAAPPAVTTADVTEMTVITSKQTVTAATTAVISVTATITESAHISQTTTSRNTEENSVSVTTTGTTAEDVPGSKFGKDYTVSPSVVYDKTGEVIDLRDFENVDGLPMDPPPADSVLTIGRMADSSDYIVYAVIDEVIYTEIDGKPYTQENLTIYSVYKGDGALNSADRISLYVPGGYMPAEEYLKNNNVYYDFPENSVVYDSGGNNGNQQLYNSYIFFLKQGSDSMQDGAFQLTEKTDISVFEYSGGRYVSLGNGALSFTQSELSDLLE